MFHNTPSEVHGDEGADPRVGFARRVNARMRELGINQSELARRMSVIAGREIGRDNISGYARAKTLPRPQFLDWLAKALEVSAEYLFPRGSVSSVERDYPPYEIVTLQRIIVC
ncbi:MAG: hypothetical protein U1E45_10980 [Geminicoccaceae bacterium]